MRLNASMAGQVDSFCDGISAMNRELSRCLQRVAAGSRPKRTQCSSPSLATPKVSARVQAVIEVEALAKHSYPGKKKTYLLMLHWFIIIEWFVEKSRLDHWGGREVYPAGIRASAHASTPMATSDRSTILRQPSFRHSRPRHCELGSQVVQMLLL